MEHMKVLNFFLNAIVIIGNIVMSYTIVNFFNRRIKEEGDDDIIGLGRRFFLSILTGVLIFFILRVTNIINLEFLLKGMGRNADSTSSFLIIAGIFAFIGFFGTLIVTSLYHIFLTWIYLIIITVVIFTSIEFYLTSFLYMAKYSISNEDLNIFLIPNVSLLIGIFVIYIFIVMFFNRFV